MTDPIALDLSLAATGFRTRLDPRCRAEHITARFGAYQTAALPDDTVSVSVALDPDFALDRPSRVEYPSTDAEQLADGTIVFRRSSEITRYDPAARAATVLARPTSKHLAPIEDPTPLDTPLRVLLSHMLPRREGLLMHASGYGDARGAVLFAAVSGGGKTTTARKLPAAHVLSDDQIALRRERNEWLAYALPFVGEYRAATVPRVCPLRAVVLLAKGDAPRLARTARPVALARMMGCVVYFLRGDPITSTLLDLCADLTARVPVFTLTTTREAPMEPVLDQLLG